MGARGGGAVKGVIGLSIAAALVVLEEASRDGRLVFVDGEGERLDPNLDIATVVLKTHPPAPEPAWYGRERRSKGERKRGRRERWTHG